jgi:hypothetical protein
MSLVGSRGETRKKVVLELSMSHSLVLGCQGNLLVYFVQMPVF